MKFREMFLKYYAPHSENDGGAAAYEAMQKQQGNAEGGDDEVIEQDDDKADPDHKPDPDDVELDENGKPKAKEGEGDPAEEEQEEEFLFDGQAIADPDLTDEDDQEGDTELVKRLRAQLRENKRLIKESAQKKDPANIPADMPRKPEMGDDGIDWDPEKYAEALDKWTEDKAAFQQNQAAQEAKREAFGKKFNEGQQRYQTERQKAIKRYAGYEKAEAAIADLPEPLQAGVMMISKDPASVVMALARNTDLRKQVEEAYNSDHISLGYLIRDIETRAGSKPKVKHDHNGVPEVKGQNGVVNVGQLEALRKKAVDSGDFTAYLAAKKRRESNASKK